LIDTNEFQLLLEASQVQPSQEVIRHLLAQPLKKEILLNLAISNGVLPLVYAQLKKHEDFAFHKVFQKHAQDIHKLNFFMSSQLLQLVFLLKQEAITILPIKGPLLSQHAYGNISMRPFSDLDVLVEVKNLVKVANVLLSLGYEAEKDIQAFSHPFILESFSDLSFVHPVTGLIIELHWKLLKSANAGLGNIENLFTNSISLPFQNTSLQSLPLEEEFLYLCVHGAKHRFERIEWMNDLNLLYERYEDTYDWQKLLRLAQEENYLTPYLLGLLILEKKYNRQIKDKQTLALLQNKKVQTLYKKVFVLHQNNYVLETKKEGIRWMELFFSIKLEDSFTQKLSILMRLIFPLYMDDILRLKNLPSSMSFLYYNHRLKRQFLKFFKRTK